jgi:hypothetical protein
MCQVSTRSSAELALLPNAGIEDSVPMRDENYSPFGPMPAPRVAKPGEEVWRLHEAGTDRVQSSRTARRFQDRRRMGWLLLDGDELLFLKRCATEADARFAAQVMKDSTRNAGWIEDEKGEPR